VKLTARTIEIIKNFAAISPNGMVFPVGEKIAVQPIMGTILGVAQIDETIPTAFAISDVIQFVSCITSFTVPFLDIQSNKIVVRDANDTEQGQFVLNQASLNVVKAPRMIKFPISPEVTVVQLSKDLYTRILKSSGIVQSPQIAIVGDGKEISFRGINKDNTGVNQYVVSVGKTKETFRFVMDINMFNKLYRASDYIVEIDQQGCAKFCGDRIDYFIAADYEENA
jgi:gp45 sliding clamp, C terminal